MTAVQWLAVACALASIAMSTMAWRRAGRRRRIAVDPYVVQTRVEALEARRKYEQWQGTPAQQARAKADLHALALEVDLRNGDGPLWSVEYPAPTEGEGEYPSTVRPAYPKEIP